MLAQVNAQQVRYRRTKHWNPKFKKLRALKFIKVELPKFNEDKEDLSEEQIRSKMKEMGVLPPRPWVERPFYLSATGGIFEPYVPPEGDGKISPITTQVIHVELKIIILEMKLQLFLILNVKLLQGAKQKLQFLEKKTKTMLAIRKIRSFEEDFDAPVFCTHTENIYKQIHEAMANKDLEKLEDLVTERAYPEVIHNIESTTIHWKYLETIELPRIVHARCTDVISKDNLFGQVTVRFHTKQVKSKLKIYTLCLHIYFK